ncbi:unnamed protein product, partial [Meganyctiphanes norvegica]
ECREGFFIVDGSTQCFRLYDDKSRTWEEAQSKCQNEGLLAAKPTDRVAATVRKYIFDKKGDGGVWLDAQGDGDNMAWQLDGRKISRSSILWWPILPGKWFNYTNCLLLLAYRSNWREHPNKPYLTYPCANFHRTLCEDVGPLLFNSIEAFVNISEKINLNCGIRSHYFYCTWEKDNNIIQIEDVYKDVYSGISRPDNTTNNQCGIVVDKATIEDQGIWTCKIYSQATVLTGSKKVTLAVTGTAPPCYRECGIHHDWVCGTDNKSYQNPCSLIVSACVAKQTNVTKKYQGKCEVVK